MSNQKGFTLVEILAVLIIFAIILAIGIPKVISLNKNAEDVGIKMAIIDLNGREMKCWTEIKLGDGWVDDQKIFDSCDYEIEGYQWTTLVPVGGQIVFKESTTSFRRRLSAQHEPAAWSIGK